eukprot:TRINITY_DN67069_c0_g1_i1.p1 TRINITY_DN67069_c0_g1~~TRINITY_DN67069_c0_g1_i1.p1  ORF type:complete len:155 (+),score=21.47 TRINITY_DN67069_c0_g1_i1:71-535(+)
MKLTKLLLRFDPPGMGLECMLDDGTFDIRHMELPDRNAVQSVADVMSLADQLRDSEPELLERKRSMLVQQLARLYRRETPIQVGSSVQDEEDGSSKDSAAPLIETVKELPFSFRPSVGGLMPAMTPRTNTPELQSFNFRPSVGGMMHSLQMSDE